MNTKWASLLKLLIAASILVSFCSYVFASPAMAKQGSTPITSGDASTRKSGRSNTSNLPKCTHPAQQTACRL